MRRLGSVISGACLTSAVRTFIPRSGGQVPTEQNDPLADAPRGDRVDVDDSGFVKFNLDNLRDENPVDTSGPGSEPTLRFLKAKERMQLARFIADEFYNPEKDTTLDPIEAKHMAQFEVSWIEEWALGSGDPEEPREVTLKRAQKAVLERVDLHKPLSYIIGIQPFFGCTIQCEKPIMVPRTETEHWVSWLIQQHLKDWSDKELTVLDVCSGTGCIGVAIAKNVSKARVQAVDVDPQAVLLTRRNAELNGVSDRHRTMHSDMFSKLIEDSAHHKRYDIVVSNPPYIHPSAMDGLEPSVRLWETPLALMGDEQRRGTLQYYKELSEHSRTVLKPYRSMEDRFRPSLVMEVGDQADLVAEALRQTKQWKEVRIHPDLAGVARYVTAML